MATQTGQFESTDNKPVLPAQIFNQDELDRIHTAFKATPRLVDETAARLAPATIWGNWLDELGLPDLADRARIKLANTTRTGDYLLTVGSIGRTIDPHTSHDGD